MLASLRRGKSELQKTRIPSNRWLGRPKGKCNRKQTTTSVEKVKRQGKSLPAILETKPAMQTQSAARKGG